MTPAELKETLNQAMFMQANGRHDECVRLANEALNEHLDTPEAIFLIARSMLDSGRVGLAHALFMHFLQIKPNVSAAWNNLGHCYQEMHQLDQAERSFRRAIKLEPNDSAALSNLGLIHYMRAEPEMAVELGKRALKFKEGGKTILHNLGLAQLQLRQWKEGWENYEASVGYNGDRIERCYRDEVRWDGTKGKVVVAYGEQGIGDEISFASCVPDLIKDCKETVLDCDERLKGLFQRSFPDATVYGTRFKQHIDWMDAHVPDYRVAFGSLPKYYRNRTEDFPGTPYLVADPERRTQWRALLNSISDKPKIGISWQGGKIKSGRLRRSVSLEALMPVLKQDATFISLQYTKNAQQEIKELEESKGIKIHHWPRAAEAIDYDEPAALVAELDMVVSVTTAVIHLSGALGVPALVLTPKQPIWRYGLDGESLPWYKCVTLIRQKKSDWLDPIAEVAYRVRNFILNRNGDHQLHGISDRSRLVA